MAGQFSTALAEQSSHQERGKFTQGGRVKLMGFRKNVSMHIVGHQMDSDLLVVHFKQVTDITKMFYDFRLLQCEMNPERI